MQLCRTWALFGLALLFGLVWSRRARADEAELPVAVLTIQTLDAFEQADSLTSALKRVVDEAPGWSTAKTEKEYALQVLVLSLGCSEPPDEACEQKIADEIKVDRFVWGVMKKEGPDVVGVLHLWIRGQGRKSTKFRYSSNLTVAVDEALLGVARDRFAELAGGPPPGVITVRAGKHDGDVLVDGVKTASLKGGVAVLTLAPGSHKIDVEVPGHTPASTQIEVSPRDKREITLQPIPEESDGPPFQKIFGFTALGLGVAAAAPAIYGGVRAMQLKGDLEPYTTDGQTIPKDKDGCDPGPNGAYPNLQGSEAGAALDLCEEGDTAELLQLVFWPVAGALAGTGIILLATADWSGTDAESSGRSPIRVEPRFGPYGGDVSVSIRF
jgi:hypothetical protein